MLLIEEFYKLNLVYMSNNLPIVFFRGLIDKVDNTTHRTESEDV